MTSEEFSRHVEDFLVETARNHCKKTGESGGGLVGIKAVLENVELALIRIGICLPAHDNIYHDVAEDISQIKNKY